MRNKNPSEWRVSSNLIAGRKLYGVYRIRDINEPDHSGNRESRGELYEAREEAEVLAERLNEEEKR